MNELGKRLAAQDNASLSSAILNLIRSSFIIDFGIIMDIPEQGIVTVASSVANNNSDIIVTTCTFANIASQSFTVDVKPEKGDKVIVLYPRKFSSDMFSTKNNDVIINEYSTGYNILAGIAIPINKYDSSSHNNLLSFAEGGMELKLGFDGEKNSVTVKVNSDGTLSTELNDDESFTVNNGVIKYTKGNNYVEFNLSTDGTVKVSDSSGTSIISKSEGITLKDNNGCTITSSSSSIKINGKLEIKK